MKQFAASLLATFPDFRITIEDQVAEGDKVVTRWTFTGTHQGEFMGLAPTGKQVTTSGINISRIVEGKIVELREEWDAQGFFQQLGALPQATEANKALLQRVFEEGCNKHNLALFDELIPDCVYRGPGVGELRGEAYRQFLASVHAAFPDGHWTIEDQVAEGDKVVTRWRFTGTHQAEIMGLAPTGKQTTISGVLIDRIVEGKIVEEWEEYDTLGMMQQLGAMPQATEANKALLRRVIEEGFNKHDLALLGEIYADCVWYGSDTGELKGEALQRYLASILAGFPNIRYTIEDLVAEGDKVVIRWSCTGSHQGEFMGLAPTGKQFTTSGTDTYRIVEGKIVEYRGQWDAQGFFRQLGALPQATEANKALLRRVVEEGFNKHNLALLDELYADCVYYSPATGELKPEALRQYWASVLAALPDGRWTIEDQVAEGDKLVTRYSCTGTHQGEFMGLAPTGKQVTCSGTDTYRIVEGKIVELREQWDALGFFQQLGALPPLAKAEDKAAA